MRLLRYFSVGAVIAASLYARAIFAQAGNDNPTGVSGEFSGSVHTGCNYDPYTTNSKRSVTDLVVAGGVGAYPLAFVRTANSRYYPELATDMGAAGSWRHSHQWSVADNSQTVSYVTPPSYTVDYPDGRRVTFNGNTGPGDPYSRSSSLGVHDRLHVILDNPSAPTSGNAYLLLSDGTQVWFRISVSHFDESDDRGHVFHMIGYHYTLQGIIDPYGQMTTVVTDTTKTTVTEPAGRMLKIFYKTGPAGDNVVDRVEEWLSLTQQGRTVTYNYSAYVASGTTYSALTSVSYPDGITAAYTYQANNTSPSGRPLLATCDDPMYAGPMRKISYAFATGTNPDGTLVASGQILSEKSGTSPNPTVSTLTITGTNTRKETRADGKLRTFTYATGLLSSWTDFRGISSSLTRDAKGYVNSTTDRNGKTTNLTNEPLAGQTTQITSPLTPNDTPTGTPRGTVSYVYGSATCPDPNNRDGNNPYYRYSVTDEGGRTTTFLRDTNKRITQINYPDGGSESFTYNSFGQVLTHRLRTGGLETMTYDSRGLLTESRDPYHLASVDPQNPSVPASATPTLRYKYDSLDRVSDVTDALGSTLADPNHSTSYTYNSRGQVLVATLPVDPIDGQRHTITNIYNPDGTLLSTTDQLGHTGSFTYDDYRRVRSVTSPGHNTPLTAFLFYDTAGTSEDYTHTDANVTHATSPGGKKITTAYDENYRKLYTIVADTTLDAAKTSYGYDNNGNVTSVISPNEQPGQQFAGKSTTSVYDERNRLMSVTDALNNTTTFKYDAAGRKASVTRANGQLTTFDSYDVMNRLLQQTEKQTPDPDAVTKYTYYASGLLRTMQDPRLVAISSPEKYAYDYDLMGRKTKLTYPLDAAGANTTELWHYDTVGRIDTFTNRNAKVQTFAYDNLHRQTGFNWNDSLTPSVTFGYDVASRMTSIVNANATIGRNYFNDNSLNTETATYADSTARTVTYSYDADGNRATIQYPNGAYSFTYNYTGRNQLWKLINNSGGATVTTYGYEPDGNLTSRAPDNSTSSTLTYDALDRITNISHALNGTTRTFAYAYDSVSNRKWAKRDGGNGDVFGYDLNDQSTSILLNVANPDTTAPGSQTISYDANGNRTTFAAYGPSDIYTTNNLNQYSARNSNQALYDANGNTTTGVDGSIYSYDAQNRLVSATKGSTIETFKYDGLNRQVSRSIGAGSPTYNVYDGWELIGEYASGSTSPSTAYLPGVKNLTSNQYYYQDASGSTSHLAASTGQLLEWYRYDLQGTPIFYNSLNTQLSTSNYSVRRLFTGQQWYSELGLYDLRHRFYSPDLGRFVQADPIGFSGDPTNLYRYCGNNPLNGSDPLGLVNWGLFGRGALNVGVGVTSGAALFFAEGGSGGLATPAVVFFGTSAVWSVTTGTSQVVAAFAGTSQQQRGAGAMPTNISGAVAKMSSPNVGKALQAIEAVYSLQSGAQALMQGNSIREGLAGFADLYSSADEMIANVDAAAVEQELAAAASTFENPSLAPSFARAPFDNVGLSLTNFGASAPLGLGFSFGGSSFGFGSSLSSLNFTGPPTSGAGSGGWPFGGASSGWSISFGGGTPGGGYSTVAPTSYGGPPGGKTDPPPKQPF